MIVLVKRVILALVIIFAAITLQLAMIHAVPGDPVTVMPGLATPELQAAMRERLGLDDPFFVQLFRFFWRTATGDLGTDVIRSQPVWNLIASQLPHTLALVLCSIGWAALVGIPLGCFSAAKRGSFAR